MPFTKELPEWGNPGQRPPQTSIDQGYKPMDHPPADWFNWYQYTAYQALKELQTIGATKEDVSSAVSDAKAYTDKHEKRTDNPHKTTKAQVGLGNVDNVQQASKADFDAHTKDNDRHITATERSNWNAKETTTGAKNKADTAEMNAKAYTDELAARRDNPHEVTKDQVGLSNVDNVKQADYYAFRQHDNNGIRHISQVERDKWNGGQLKKLTDDQGKYLASIQDGLDFHQIVDELDQSFFFYTANTGVNTPSLSTRGLYIGTKTYGEALAMDYSGGTWRKTLKASGWSDWVQIETSEGAQKKVDAHANKADLHVTKSEKDKWNGGQLYPLTTQDGQRIKIMKGQNLFDYPTGFYFGAGVLNHPGDDDSAWYYYDISDVPADLAPPQGLKKIVATRSYDNRTWISTIHKEGEFTGWRELVTDIDIPWLDVTYKNGAKTGDRPVQYRKVGNTLHLNGHVLTDREIVFGSIPTSCAPSKGVVKLVATSGTTGYSKIIVYASGDMKITGVMATTESKVNGYYIDINIPLT
ncbi:hypothetical protein AXI59_00530 [Bacillus nakamurai]|uniref:hypothetical protein n=1 Tax=Bacillus nakamurai TaxID=1793963 RepID=UPI00077822C4|nr:hypothetical protein [Bacillus nakamurai]KXZ21073.1 hypothetical protein AXI59_00530 [Bacillus nakamurai]